MMFDWETLLVYFMLDLFCIDVNITWLAWLLIRWCHIVWVGFVDLYFNRITATNAFILKFTRFTLLWYSCYIMLYFEVLISCTGVQRWRVQWCLFHLSKCHQFAIWLFMAHYLTWEARRYMVGWAPRVPISLSGLFVCLLIAVCYKMPPTWSVLCQRCLNLPSGVNQAVFSMCLKKSSRAPSFLSAIQWTRV